MRVRQLEPDEEGRGSKTCMQLSHHVCWQQAQQMVFELNSCEQGYMAG